MAGSILLISGAASQTASALAAELAARGIGAVRAEPVVEAIEREAAGAEVFLLFAEDLVYSAPDVLSRLGGLCFGKGKLLCVVGYREELAVIEAAVPKNLIEREFIRPLDVKQFADGLQALLAAQEERKGQKSILLIDDDATFLRMMQDWLSAKYRVSAVKSGAQALAYLKARTPDLILLDYDMPETQGPEVLQKLRDEPSSADIPVIFLTGKCDERSEANVAPLEPDGYLLKAMGKERVLAAVERFFATHGHWDS